MAPARITATREKIWVAIVEADPPRLLVQTWRLLMDPSTAAEPFSTLTYLIEGSASQPGVCKLTVTRRRPRLWPARSTPRR